MNVESLRLSNDTKKLIKTIQLRMELHEGQQFKVHKDFGQVVELLKAASLSERVEVRSAYTEFVRSLDDEKIGFFKVLGAINEDVVNKVSKAGKQKSNTSSGEKASKGGSEEIRYDENGRKMKKTVYRGQVRWV